MVPLILELVDEQNAWPRRMCIASKAFEFFVVSTERTMARMQRCEVRLHAVVRDYDHEHHVIALSNLLLFRDQAGPHAEPQAELRDGVPQMNGPLNRS
jgi:hypothetical protein